MTDTPRALLVGYGDIGSRLTPLLLDRGFHVTGMRRHPERAQHLELGDYKNNFNLCKGDAASVSDWQRIWVEGPFDVVIFTLTPTAYDQGGYQQGYVAPLQAMFAANLFTAEAAPVICYVSSTAVYGEREGQWVNEETQAKPANFSGEILLAAENLVLQSECPGIVVRASGVYGPGRERMQQSILEGTYTITPAWTNRIHADDLARVIEHLVLMRLADLPMHSIYLATDSEPLQAEVYVARIAERLGIAVKDLPRSEQIGPRGSKRLSNQRLLDTGFEFLYPTAQ